MRVIGENKNMAKYKRVLIKLSGETFEKENNFGLDFKKIQAIAKEIKEITKAKIQVSLVVGAGNIFRGRYVKEGEIDRVTADYMGMIATIINALALQNCLTKINVDARVLSSLTLSKIMEEYVHKRAINHLAKGRVVIYAGGTGNPFFSTDSAAILRALETNCEIVLKATQVEGVYDSDPEKNKKAKKFQKLKFSEALAKRLAIMDQEAFALCADNNLPVRVFKFKKGSLLKAAKGENLGTIITN
jgi:uridylate kinase